jgi:2,3,4,5-tetrahydropyridine-2-carboxylate N-succinyltransferase
MQEIKTTIEQAWDQRAEITPVNVSDALRDAVNTVIGLLDSGEVRVAEPSGDGWQVNQWLKKAVLLSFRIRENKMISSPDARYYDKVPGKFDHYTEEDFKQGGFRVVPSAAVRQGVYIAKNVVLMPSYVNIGARVDEGQHSDGIGAAIGKWILRIVDTVDGASPAHTSEQDAG